MRERDTAVIHRRRLPVELAVLGAVIIVMAALGPFGSYAAAPGARLAHWALFLIGGYLCFRPVIAAGEALSLQSGLPRPAAIATACLFGALPTSIIVALVSAGYRWRAVTIADVAEAYPQVLIVGATVTAVQLLVRRARAFHDEGAAQLQPPVPEELEAPVALKSGSGDPEHRSHGGAPLRSADADRVAEFDPYLHQDDASAPIARGILRPHAAERQSPFLDLLPPHLGREVICLENEDHYIRVHTAVGNAMILMRMRDAVAQLAHLEGERVHRGWWVARHAVAGVVRQERSLKLRLLNGREVPVARSAVPLLRDKGWLAGVPVDS